MRKIQSATLSMWLSVTGAALGQDALPIPVVPVPDVPPAAAAPARLNLDVSPPAATSSQQLATVIGERLRQNAKLRHFRVDVTYSQGIAELTGMVTDIAQRDEVVWTVQAVPGVERVRDRLTILQPSGVMPAQAKGPAPDFGPALVAPGGVPFAPGGGGAMPPEPLPIYQGNPGVPNPSLQPPPLPPYAWPTYAPYNNYSRVAYPTQYPAEAFPFIGPNYPFPKVPLGWRSVTLTWEDGHWWYGRSPTGHDWWRIRYW